MIVRSKQAKPASLTQLYVCLYHPLKHPPCDALSTYRNSENIWGIYEYRFKQHSQMSARLLPMHLGYQSKQLGEKLLKFKFKSFSFTVLKCFVCTTKYAISFSLFSLFAVTVYGGRAEDSLWSETDCIPCSIQFGLTYKTGTAVTLIVIPANPSSFCQNENLILGIISSKICFCFEIN